MNKNTTMLQLFQEFDEATKSITEMKWVVDSLKRNPNLESVTFTSDSLTMVIGETYIIKSAGDYTIKSNGSGKVSYLVENTKTRETIYEGELDDTSESGVMHLTVGDKVYLHASADNGMVESITLQQKTSLFDVLGGKLDECNRQFEYLNARIDNLLSTGDIDEMNDKIDEVFQSVSEGKILLANAITDKGTATNADDTFATMALNILALAIDDGIDTSLFTAAPGDILQGKTAGVNNQAILGTMVNRNTIDSSVGGLDSNNSSTPIQKSEDLKVSTQTIDGKKRLCMKIPNGFYDGATYVGELLDTVASVLKVVADKIVVGYNICGVNGTATGDGTATSNQMLNNSVAYVNGNKVVGTMPDNVGMTSPISVVNNENVNTIEVIPKAGYHGGTSGYKTCIPYNTIAELLDIKSDSIVKGTSICGVDGDVEVKVGCDFLDVCVDVNLDNVRSLSCTRVDFLKNTINPNFITKFIPVITKDSKAHELYSRTGFARVSLYLTGNESMDGVIIGNTITWKFSDSIHETINVSTSVITLIDSSEDSTVIHLPIPPSIIIDDIDEHSLYVDFYEDVRI